MYHEDALHFEPDMNHDGLEEDDVRQCLDCLTQVSDVDEISDADEFPLQKGHNSIMIRASKANHVRYYFESAFRIRIKMPHQAVMLRMMVNMKTMNIKMMNMHMKNMKTTTMTMKS